jgi:argininosuccinate lyase
VGSLVAMCEGQSVNKLAELTIDQFKATCKIIEDDVYQTLNPIGVCKAYQSKGAAGPDSAKAQIAYWKDKLKTQ